VIHVDPNVPMYLVGAEQPSKRRVVELVPQLLTALESLVVQTAEIGKEDVDRARTVSADHPVLSAPSIVRID
jgi:hypothetical protein